MSTDHRNGLGALGERFAEAHLVARGYRVLERNYRTRNGELDLVVSDAGCLVFCEVKTRLGAAAAGPYDPLVSVGLAKRRRLRSLAAEWLAERPGRPRGRSGDELRFDAIGIRLRRDGSLAALEHVEDAF